jgi:hypothetical protein
MVWFVGSFEVFEDVTLEGKWFDTAIGFGCGGGSCGKGWCGVWIELGGRRRWERR